MQVRSDMVLKAVSSTKYGGLFILGFPGGLVSKESA